MKAYKIIEELELWVKPELIDSWDNTGFQIGYYDQEIKKVLIALDLDRHVLNHAINHNIDMIITHHPIIFSPIKSITSKTYSGSLILDAIKNNILVYNAHSNLDITQNGVNDELAKILGIKNTKILSEAIEIDNKSYGYGKVGEIKDININDFIEVVKMKLEVEDIIVYGKVDNQIISKVSVCGGSGASFIPDVISNKSDVYITGDIKYHDAQLAYENDLILIDASHYDTEKVILPTIKNYLISKFKDSLEISVVYESTLPRAIY